MKSATVLAALLLALLMPTGHASLLAPAPADPAVLPEGCAQGDPPTAAAILVHPHAEIARLDEVAGFDSALALAPIVHPGVGVRLVRAGDAWCTVEALSFAWRAGGRGADLVPFAEAFAQLAGAPWMQDAQVRDARLVAPGVAEVVTHAAVNGIVARWTVVGTPAAPLEARFVSMAFGEDASSFQWEGFVAIPGLERAWRADTTGAAGGLVPTAPLVPSVQPPQTPAVTIFDRMSDGFRLQYNIGGGANVCPDPRIETGNTIADACSLTRRVARENYEEFLSWGLQKGWTTNVGTIYIDDATAVQCFACVFISQDFQIHMSSLVMVYLETFGIAYEDDQLAYSNIIGHEMFHNFQNAYYKPGSFMEGAYSEGTARFQETLHEYAHVSHQPASLVYAADGNGCNEETGVASHPVEFPSFSPVQWAGGDASLATGPATDQSYSACNFWMAWYGQHGIDGLLAVMQATPAHRDEEGWQEFRGIVEDATGAPIDDDLAAFARALLTGDGLTWGPVNGNGAVLDWGAHLVRWEPETLANGASRSQTIADGGMMGAKLESDGVVTLSAGARLYLVRDTGVTSTWTPLASGASVTVGGDDVWAVAIRPDAGIATVTLSYS